MARRQDAIGLRRQKGAAEDFVDRGRAAESIRIRDRLDRGVEPVVVEIAKPKLCDFFRSQLLSGSPFCSVVIPISGLAATWSIARFRAFTRPRTASGFSLSSFWETR